MPNKKLELIKTKGLYNLLSKKILKKYRKINKIYKSLKNVKSISHA